MHTPAAAEPQSLPRLPLVLSSLVFIAPLTFGRVLEWVLKGLNPSNVDVTADLAYLRPMLITTWVTFAVVVAAAAGANSAATRRYGREAAQPAWLLLAIQIVLAALYLIATWAVGNITSK